MLVGTWKTTSHQELLRVVDQLSRTKGVVSIQVLSNPTRVVYQTQPWAKVDLLEAPTEPITWADKLASIELYPYKVATLFEGIVFGWTELRRRHRYPTHVCVWDHTTFYNELFPDSSWPHEQDYYHNLYGLEVVEMKSEVEYAKDAVILCGGPVMDGGITELDSGLVITRVKES